MEDPTFSEMADYIDSREDFFEKLSPPPSGGNGSKQVNFFSALNIMFEVAHLN